MVLPKRHFDLGSYLGTLCNGFSVIWVALYTISFCLPEFMPVTIGNMNYVTVVIAGVVLAIGLFWVCGENKVLHRAGRLRSDMVWRSG